MQLCIMRAESSFIRKFQKGLVFVYTCMLIPLRNCSYMQHYCTELDRVLKYIHYA